MLNRVIAWSINHVFLVLLGTAFAVGAGIWALANTPLDAIPDLSDVQVIVYTEYPGQAPQVIEDQITYPLSSTMLAVPKSKVVRGFSFFGASFVYVIFEDGTDLYWARSRVLEYLSAVAGKLPAGVAPSLGPDATSVGWVYQYVLQSDRHSLDELRSIQDWYLRYQLTTAEGVTQGLYQIDSPADRVKVEVLSPAGIVVDTFSDGAQGSGRHEFTWPGAAAVADPTGYRFRITANSGSTALSATALTRDRVDAVNTTGSALTLELVNAGSVPYAAIQALD